MEKDLKGAVEELGCRLERAHPYKEREQHGFIASQREGLEVFAGIDKQRPIIIAESVWQYSYHVLPGLIDHKGPILTLANWSGTWPGLVGMLNLNGCLTKAGITYATLWGEDFTAADFRKKLKQWLESGAIDHDTSHVIPLRNLPLPDRAAAVADSIAEDIRRNKSILGIFDEGCMGMYNAIIPDELLFPSGFVKERLSQSALYAAMRQTPESEARDVYRWLVGKGFTFKLGSDEATELTEAQILEQCKMYIAALRIGDRYGCEAIGIQYQLGLTDLCPASDLAEGLLNNSDRPPVKNAAGEVIRGGLPFVHFNEVDECAGIDGILTNRVHRALGQPPETTLHDIRWGDADRSGSTDDYVWVFEISGAAPPAHHIGGYAGTVGERQPPMYFRLGGSTCKGVARPGEIVWSRIFIENGQLHMDLGRAKVVELPEEETERRLRETTYQWPVMNAVLYGVTRDQMMARHKANHIQVAYAENAEAAELCLYTKAALADKLGMNVSLCGCH
ncbi:MAG: fucose isomerase [Candidatus Eisenbacteria bacterium]|uniref:Fucose isomerase n=1 Tax=Eiseniibacteriota bacterium TaxID=2212470 RepID=A0A948RYJ9_UNCEI|nr:fucose isomerase [Candidatus Eisenbacteria bacterium]MBU1951215.1 fucose isomerase [Candidatus Eisenbacteria bacterium]MBU2691963.1 fucose isomerase [Candidatus Eisenbacteria bacterium]